MIYMKAEIISVGTELLLGHIIDTNKAYLSQKLAGLGIDSYRHTTIGDNPARLAFAITEAFTRADIVITIGGLGPTVDDITLCAIGSATSRSLVYNKKIESHIKKYFRKRGLKKYPKDAFKQAYIPRGARWFENKVGTAAAIVLEPSGKILIALPGPPRELIPLFDQNIVPYLKKRKIFGACTIKTKTLKVYGIMEAEVNRILKDLLSLESGTTMGIYVKLGEVELKITSKAKNEKIADREINKVERAIRQRLQNYVYGSGNETLEYVIGKILAKRKKTLSTAESCTGGLIANRITNISGSSSYFKMGIISYSNSSKTALLNILPEKIKRYGAVSREIAMDMAVGVRKLSKSDYSIGVTGIAGPMGKTKSKPVGLVYISVSGKDIIVVKECRFTGAREEIKHQALLAALDLLRAVLHKPKR